MSVAQLVARIFINAGTAVAVAGWQMLAPAIVTIAAGLALGHVYMMAQLPVKRLMSNAMSPIIGHVHNALVGLGALLCLHGSMQARLMPLFSLCSSVWCTRHFPEGAPSKT